MEQAYRQFFEEFIGSITRALVKGDVGLEFMHEGDQWRINLVSIQGRSLIGEHKEIVNSLQHIVRVAFSKRFPGDRTHFILDVNLFRQNREEFINKYLMALADAEVLQAGNSLILLHLTSYERRIVHHIMSDVNGLETVSVGNGSERRLIIRPTSDTGSASLEKAKVIDVDREVEQYLDKK